MGEVYSYHTFMFPFTWETNDKKLRNAKEFAKIFDDVGGASEEKERNIWQRINVKEDKKRTLDLSKNENKKYYNAYQFFNEAGRSIIFDNSESEIIFCYKVKNEVLKEKPQYIIQVNGTEYALDIRGIYLKIFNTGIAIIYIECENLLYSTFKDVKIINEYGRRVSLPFWPSSADGYKKCADGLIVYLKNKEISYLDDFKETIKGVENSAKSMVSVTYVSILIRKMLDANAKEFTFRSIASEDKKEIHIRPILDGKMYVSCCIVGNSMVEELVASFDEDNNTFTMKAECNIAELLSVDLEEEGTYSNKKEREEFLEKHLYYVGCTKKTFSLLAITEQSCIKILKMDDDKKSKSGNFYEIEYHHEIYNQIIMIGLAQRMAIANFQQKIAKISQGIEASDKKFDNRKIRKIMELQERFVAFQNQFLLYEVTAQREGTYIYNKIQEELHIVQENETLSNRLTGIYELASIKQGYEFNKGALIISIIALVHSTFSSIDDAGSIAENTFAGYGGYGVLGVEVLICIVLMVYILFKYKK